MILRAIVHMTESKQSDFLMYGAGLGMEPNRNCVGTHG